MPNLNGDNTLLKALLQTAPKNATNFIGNPNQTPVLVATTTTATTTTQAAVAAVPPPTTYVAQTTGETLKSNLNNFIDI